MSRCVARTAGFGEFVGADPGSVAEDCGMQKEEGDQGGSIMVMRFLNMVEHICRIDPPSTER